ncbi:glycosyltransferase family 4 protein [Cyclobacterium salsum]|uniref:glycosyltransferase family 4 protein n=1 Tax=Cyclobacterium salsum TaxID=2666329 RepID=UPI0013914515|nr:glycosyltransferase family 4 protein [Cyclobacterium salsum]
MKIAIASKGDPFDMKTWSGIPAHICDYLRGGGHTVYNIDLKYPKEPWHYNWYRRYYHRLFKKWFLSDVEPYILKRIAKQLDDKVAEFSPDVVIVIHGDFLAYSSFKQPSIIIHDATFASLLNYYPAFTGLTKRSVKAGNLMYQRALNRADAAIYSSDWASRSAIKDYKIGAHKVTTIPFGANIIEIPNSKTVRNWINKRADQGSCNFLFLGVDWERKGGPDGLKFVVELNRIGVKAKLFVAGCSPKIDPQDERFVVKLGFLRKDVKEEAEKLEQLLINSHALLLPSHAECYGCVYCEANAYALPALGRETGGVSEIIKDGVNGLLMNFDESPECFAGRWTKVWEDRSRYVKLSLNSRIEFDERLNYQEFQRKLERILLDITHDNIKDQAEYNHHE